MTDLIPAYGSGIQEANDLHCVCSAVWRARTDFILVVEEELLRDAVQY